MFDSAKHRSEKRLSGVTSPCAIEYATLLDSNRLRHGYEVNQYVTFGCVSFYMRVGIDLVTKVPYAKVTTVTSSRPGSGVFKKVLPELHRQAAQCGADVFIFDCILSERLYNLLQHLGYTIIKQLIEQSGQAGTCQLKLI